GSAVYSEAGMNALKKTAKVVYLKLSFEELSSRLHDIKGRGVVLREGQTLKDLYDERIPLYERYADITVTEDGLSPEETVDAIVKALERQ
ncbi:MAG: shikimate kinase, partial [Lachnospiraceae bacterium]|nr:shikimate kinase [Lachnospiraceae bacterium]